MVGKTGVYDIKQSIFFFKCFIKRLSQFKFIYIYKLSSFTSTIIIKTL